MDKVVTSCVGARPAQLRRYTLVCLTGSDQERAS
jgi:hypothetical protein